MSCPFCGIITDHAAGCRAIVPLADAAPGDIVRAWDDAIALVPLNPAVPVAPEGGPGHLLVIPRLHRPNLVSDPAVAAATMGRMSELLKDLGWSVNVGINEGAEAGQTVFHLHAHAILRTLRDGLHMPWTPRYLSPAQLAELASRVEDYQNQRAHLTDYAEAAQQGIISPLGMTGRPHAAVVGLAQAPQSLLAGANRVTLADARKRLSAVIGEAAGIGPVVLTHYGRDVAAVVALSELAGLDIAP